MAIPKLYTPKQTAEQIHIQSSTLSKWRCICPGRLPFVKLGGKILYSEDAIAAFIRRSTHGEPQAARTR